MHEKFELAQSQRKFARLLKLAEDQWKALEENPRPFIDRAYSLLSRHMQLIDDIKNAASGFDEMAVAPAAGSYVLETISDTVIKRLSKVQKLIEDFEKQN